MVSRPSENDMILTGKGAQEIEGTYTDLKAE